MTANMYMMKYSCKKVISCESKTTIFFNLILRRVHLQKNYKKNLPSSLFLGI